MEKWPENTQLFWTQTTNLGNGILEYWNKTEMKCFDESHRIIEKKLSLKIESDQMIF